MGPFLTLFLYEESNLQTYHPPPTTFKDCGHFNSKHVEREIHQINIKQHRISMFSFEFIIKNEKNELHAYFASVMQGSGGGIKHEQR